MASTYSDLKIQLMATGENSGTWGTITNTNLGTAIEEAITGSADVAFSSADVTLTLINTNETQTARNLRLNLTGTSGGNRNLIVPAIEKVYIINNGLANQVTVKNAAGTGVVVPTGKTMYVYNNGTNVVDAITHLTSLTTGALTSTSTTVLNGTTIPASKTLVDTNSTQTLTNKTVTGSFTGPLTGNASTATTATNATNVAVTTSTTASNFKVPFANTTANTTGNYNLLQDSTATFTYNPSTDVLTVGTVSGELNGNASTATALETARNIGGVSFDGTANIDLPGVNTAGNQNTTGTASNVTDTVAIANGGTGETTRQNAMDALAGAVTSGQYLRGNGTDVVMSAIEVADVPTLNQNTTGSAASLTTARSINGTNFNGTAGITTANWGTTRTLWGNSVNGSANITGALRPAAGSVSAPAFSTSSDTNTGIFFPAADTMAFTEGGVERMRITSAGDVGIGTSAPATKLDVHGASGVAFQIFENSTGNNSRLIISQEAGLSVYNNTFGTGSTNGHVFQVGGVERARIDTSGNLLVGTTTTAIAGSGAYISNIGQLNLSQGSGGGFAQFKNNVGTVIGSISNSANTATAYNTSSDYRLKQNIVDAPSASDSIDAIQIRSFDWKADGSHQKYGVIAQELEPIAPEAVSKGEKEDDMWGVDYSKLVPMLIKEVQSLRSRIAELESK